MSIAGVGIQFGMAKLFRGQGQYKQQTYNHLLLYMPVQIISFVLILLALLLVMLAFSPLTLVLVFIIALAILGLGIYSIILNVFAIMATHRMSGGKATGVVLIPYGALVIFYFVLSVIYVAFIISITVHP